MIHRNTPIEIKRGHRAVAKAFIERGFRFKIQSERTIEGEMTGRHAVIYKSGSGKKFCFVYTDAMLIENPPEAIIEIVACGFRNTRAA